VSDRSGRFATLAPTLAYIAPFAVYVGLMGLERVTGAPFALAYPVRLVITCLVIALASRSLASFRAVHFLATFAVGAAVFVIWIAPDVLIGYRHHWLFENFIFGSAAGLATTPIRGNGALIACHFVGSAAIVPVVEELFWRGWLMRWLIQPDFQKVRLGTYTPSSFWLVAILFAIEHGSYWEVGLAAGIIYNLWMIRTRSLADCIVAHAVTNAILSIYVIAAGHWQYWP
jgi:uncharacterized protein